MGRRYYLDKDMCWPAEGLTVLSEMPNSGGNRGNTPFDPRKLSTFLKRAIPPPVSTAALAKLTAIE